MGSQLFVAGMQGLGDNIHQRAIVRLALKEHDRVWLKTPWPSLYWDFPKVRCRFFRSTLRTQAFNEQREAHLFSTDDPTDDLVSHNIRLWYTPDDVREHGSIIKAMVANAGYAPGASIDFSFPIDPAVDRVAMTLLARINPKGKPVLIYRPLVERTEWRNGRQRNPDFDAYYDLLMTIRDRCDFHVVSIADLVPGVEWLSGHPIAADNEFHYGQLHIHLMAAMFARATLVYSAIGFAGLLAQAVGTPLVVVAGGREDCRSHYEPGTTRAPVLGIDPIKSCRCYDPAHTCDKRIDLVAARVKLEGFIDALFADRSTGTVAVAADRLARFDDAIPQWG
jgi:hypothetical protein